MLALFSISLFAYNVAMLTTIKHKRQKLPYVSMFNVKMIQWE